MLRFIVLGLLSGEPCYGYELRGVFERFLGGTWPLHVSQIYPVLNKLEADGLVACSVVPQGDAPDRKVFAITDNGRDELHRWLDVPDALPVRLRDEFFMKILVATHADSGRATQILTAQRAAHFSALAEVTEAQKDPNLHPATALLLEGAALRLEADLTWLDRCATELKDQR